MNFIVNFKKDGTIINMSCGFTKIYQSREHIHKHTLKILLPSLFIGKFRGYFYSYFHDILTLGISYPNWYYL